MWACIRIVLGTVLAMSCMDVACAEEERYTTEMFRKYFADEVTHYKITMNGKLLAFQDQPLIFWQNTERQQDQGALYQWTHNGKPCVLISIFTYEYSGKVYCRHETISLADEPLEATFKGKIVWSPKTPGVTWKECQMAVPETPARRLIQMRAFAREFTAELTMSNNKTSHLNLMPQPLLRYEAPGDGVIDGAIFSFAVGTDPELLLVIETRKGSDGTLAMFYSPVRSHYHQLELRHQGNVVWTATKDIGLEQTLAGQKPWASKPFFVFTPDEKLPPAETLK